MQKNMLSLASKVMLVFAFCLVAPLAYAEDVTTAQDVATVQVLAESSNLASESEALEGVVIEEPKSIPSGLGIWWKNFTEGVSLGLTFNPVKKAEKQLKFAEEKTKLAEYMIANSTDAKVQEKAQKMLERADEYAKKIEEKKAEFLNNKDERAKKLLENITKHYLNKEKALDKIEDKIPADKLEEFAKMRENVEANAKAFLENIKNDVNVPQEVKDRIAQRVLKMENIKTQRTQIRTEQKGLLNELKEGNQEAKVELEKLRDERSAQMEKMREEFKTQREEIINKIQSGDKTATDELKKLNKEQTLKAQEVRKEVKQKQVEVKKERMENAGEIKQQIQENRPQPNVIRIELPAPSTQAQ